MQLPSSGVRCISDHRHKYDTMTLGLLISPDNLHSMGLIACFLPYLTMMWQLYRFYRCAGVSRHTSGFWAKRVIKTLEFLFLRDSKILSWFPSIGHGNPVNNLESPCISVSTSFTCLSLDSLILRPSLYASLHNKVRHMAHQHFTGGKGFGKLLGLVITFGLNSYNWGRKKFWPKPDINKIFINVKATQLKWLNLIPTTL